MEHYNKIVQEMEQLGFTKENDIFIFDNITYNNMIINGQQFKQPQHNYIHLQYIGEGYIMDNDCGESDEDENGAPFSQFDVLNEDKESVLTICVTDIDDIKTFLNIQ
jgi:hypothetical protein